MVGRFASCLIEKGEKITSYQNMEINESEDEDDEELEDEIEEEADDALEQDVLLGEISPGNYAALYSHESSAELFYIVEVIAKNIAEEDIDDIIKKGDHYLSCKYLEKVEQNIRKGIVKYKSVEREVAISPRTVFYPCVDINKDLIMRLDDYQFLSDCI